MRFVTYTDNEHARLAPYLRTRLGDYEMEALGLYELLGRIIQCPAIIAPPRLRPDEHHPDRRGPHRRIVRALGRELGTFVLLLSCGHVVGRQTENKRGAYCEACLHCDLDLDEDAAGDPGWIAITDAWPSEGAVVLVVSDGAVFPARVLDGSFIAYHKHTFEPATDDDHDDDHVTGRDYAVSHWRPLPEAPPKEDGRG